MTREFWAAVVVAVAYAVGEAAWLWGASGFYSEQFSRVLGRGSVLAVRSTLAAVLVYPLLLFGFWFFVLRAHRGAVAACFLRGLAFGAVVYGVYNLTNRATLPGWSWTLVAVDTTWGALWFAALGALYAAALESLQRSASA